MTDRRGKPRFDIVGELWGTIETLMQFRVENISRGGFLFHSEVPMDVDSVHQLRLTRGPVGLSTQVTVRHVRETAGPDGRPVFMIGVAFVGSDADLAAHVEHWADVESAGESAYV